MKEQIKELEQKIQEEIWRIQMIDYPTPNTSSALHKMQEELKQLKKQIMRDLIAGSPYGTQKPKPKTKPRTDISSWNCVEK